MKTMILAGLSLALAMAFCHGQGYIAFANFGSGENWPFYRADGTNRVTVPFVADLQWALYSGRTIPPTASGLTNFAGFNTVFKSGSGAGYFLGGALLLPPTQQIVARAVVWNPQQAPSFTQAMITPGAEWGFSNMSLLTPWWNPPPPLGLGVVVPGYVLRLNPIPEPDSLVLFGASLLLLGWWRFRERR